MERKIKKVIDGVAKHYPMRVERMKQKRSGNGNPALARYACYKMLSELCVPIDEIAIHFDCRPVNVIRALKRYNEWLSFHPELKNKYELLKALTLK